MLPQGPRNCLTPPLLRSLPPSQSGPGSKLPLWPRFRLLRLFLLRDGGVIVIVLLFFISLVLVLQKEKETRQGMG